MSNPRDPTPGAVPLGVYLWLKANVRPVAVGPNTTPMELAYAAGQAALLQTIRDKLVA